LFAWRAPQLVSTGVFQPISREGGLLLNNLILATAAAAVLLGTLYPLLLDAIGGGKVSVGAPFFNAVFIPLMIPMIAAMAVGPMLSWKRADLKPALTRLWAAAGVAVVIMAATWAYRTDGPVLGIVGAGLAAWLFAGTLVELFERLRLFKGPLSESFSRLRRTPRASWGMTLGHLGMAVTIAGMTGAGAWTTESIQAMKPGDSVTVAGYEFIFDGAKAGQGPNYSITEGTFRVFKDGEAFVTLKPEKRIYTVSKTPTTEAAIHTTFLGDLYAVVGDKDPSGAYVTRIYFNPLVSWMWMGVLIMVGGGVLSLTDRRHRIGAPSKHNAPVAAEAAEA